MTTCELPTVGGLYGKQAVAELRRLDDGGCTVGESHFACVEHYDPMAFVLEGNEGFRRELVNLAPPPSAQFDCEWTCQWKDSEEAPDCGSPAVYDVVKPLRASLSAHIACCPAHLRQAKASLGEKANVHLVAAKPSH